MATTTWMKWFVAGGSDCGGGSGAGAVAVPVVADFRRTFLATTVVVGSTLTRSIERSGTVVHLVVRKLSRCIPGSSSIFANTPTPGPFVLTSSLQMASQGLASAAFAPFQCRRKRLGELAIARKPTSTRGGGFNIPIGRNHGSACAASLPSATFAWCGGGRLGRACLVLLEWNDVAMMSMIEFVVVRTLQFFGGHR